MATCCPRTSNVVYIASDNDVGLTGVSVSSTGAFLNSGSATWTLADAEGTVVGTGSMAYVAASDGDYAGVIEDTVTDDLTENDFYTLTYAFSQSSYTLTIVKKVQAAYKTS